MNSDDINSVLKVLFSPGEWFRFPVRFLDYMPIQDAVLLSYLINRTVMEDTQDGWIVLRRADLERSLRLSKDRQIKLLDRLAENEWIKVRVEDLNTRLVRVKMLRIWTALNDEKDPQGVSRNHDRGCRETTTGGVAKPRHPSPGKTGAKEYKRKEETVERCAPDGLGGGFFGDSEAPMDSNMKHAKTLFELLSKHRKIQRKVHLKRWANSIRELQDIGVDQSRITKALEFYAKHIGEKYIPVIYSAMAFRNKFSALEDAMLRESPAEVVVDVKNLPHSLSEALSTIKSCYAWPGIAKTQLDAVVVRSYEEYERWRASAIAREVTMDDRMKRLHEHLLAFLITPPRGFIQKWFLGVSRRLQTWKDWGGDMSQFIWSPLHRDFNKQATEVVNAYSARPQDWNTYRDFVK